MVGINRSWWDNGTRIKEQRPIKSRQLVLPNSLGRKTDSKCVVVVCVVPLQCQTKRQKGKPKTLKRVGETIKSKNNENRI